MKDISDRDLLFLELLFELGSVAKACDQMDMTIRTGRRIQNKHKDVILDMTNSELASLAFPAVATYRKALTDDGGDIAKIEAKLKAADSVLDRVGASKRSVVEHESESIQPVILMPAKTAVEEPELIVDPEES